jgi:hypothetical protein
MDISPELLKEVNITREGKKYNDTKAAISRRGTGMKKATYLFPVHCGI